MSKRIQEKKEEEHAAAKLMSSRSISTSLNKKWPSSFGPDVSNILGGPQLDPPSVERVVGNCRQHSVEGNMPKIFKKLREIATKDGNLTTNDQVGSSWASHRLRVRWESLRESSSKTDADRRMMRCLTCWRPTHWSGVGTFYVDNVKSTIHIGLEDEMNLIACQNAKFGGIKMLFDVSPRLIAEIHSKFWIYPRWCMVALRGWECRCAMIKRSDRGKPDCMSFPFSLVSGKQVILQKQISSEGNRFNISNNPTVAQNCLDLMENQLSSSGMFSQDSHRLRFSDKSREIWTFDE